MTAAAARLTALAADLGHVVAVLADGLAALAADLGHVVAVLADGLAALATDLCHVPAVPADGLAALAGDVPLLALVHPCEAAVVAAAVVAGIARHDDPLLRQRPRPANIRRIVTASACVSGTCAEQ